MNIDALEAAYLTSPRYLSGPETAKLVRKALKSAFPGTKFSVRSDHNSIRVKWLDGPVQSDVDAVVDAYKGGGFDGMIDLAYSSQSWLLPDGSAAWAHSDGTAGSRGSCEGYTFDPPAPDAELVQFGAKYIFTDRDYSAEFLARVVAETCAYWGIEEAPEIKTTSTGHAYVDCTSAAARVTPSNAGGRDNVAQLIRTRSYKTAA